MAEQVLTDFIRALRSVDVRVSTGEAIDAAEAVKLIGYADRQRLSDTLRCVLAKSPAEKLAHDRLFELYFSRQAIPQNTPQDQSDTEDSAGSDEGPGDILDLMETGDETAILAIGATVNGKTILFGSVVNVYEENRNGVKGNFILFEK